MIIIMTSHSDFTQSTSTSTLNWLFTRTKLSQLLLLNTSDIRPSPRTVQFENITAEGLPAWACSVKLLSLTGTFQSSTDTADLGKSSQTETATHQVTHTFPPIHNQTVRVATWRKTTDLWQVTQTTCIWPGSENQFDKKPVRSHYWICNFTMET